MSDNRIKIFYDVYTIAKNLGKNNEFRLGYDHAAKGVPFKYEYQDEDRIPYFRGRAFAIYSKEMKFPRATWRDNNLSKAATERLVKAIQQRAVI